MELLARIATGAVSGPDGLRGLLAVYEQMAIAQSQQVTTPAPAAETTESLPALARQLVAGEQTAVVGAQLGWVKTAHGQLQHHTGA